MLLEQAAGVSQLRTAELRGPTAQTTARPRRGQTCRGALAARRDLYEILEERYGRRSTLLTSQVPVDKWHEVIGDPTYADAILDRLVHNAIASISPATAYAAPDRDQFSGVDQRYAFRRKPTRQQDASSGRHHVGTASDMIPE